MAVLCAGPGMGRVCGRVVPREGNYPFLCDDCRKARNAARPPDWRPDDWDATRLRILERDHYECQVRGTICKGVADQVDHIVARALGGGGNDENLRASCTPCNAQRGVETRQELAQLRARGVVPTNPAHDGEPRATFRPVAQRPPQSRTKWAFGRRGSGSGTPLVG